MLVTPQKTIRETLGSVAEEWREIEKTMPDPSLFSSHDYVSLWYECFAKPRDVRIYRVASGGRTIGFLPLVRRRKGPLRILSGLTNNHCLHGTPLVRKGDKEEFQREAMAALKRDAGSWDALTYDFQYVFAGDSPSFGGDPSSVRGLVTDRQNYSIRLDGSFSDYLQRDLSARTRNIIRNKRRRIEQAGAFQFAFYQGEEAVRHFGEFLRLEDSGWKGANGSSIRKCGAEYGRFYDGFVRMLAERGKLRLYFLVLDGNFIAGEFGYVDGDTYHSFKIAYDESHSTYSPGVLLISHVIEDLMTNFPEIKRAHLFPWNCGYKHRFVNEESYYRDLLCFSPSLRGKSVELLYDVKQGVRSLSLRLRRRESAPGSAPPEEPEEAPLIRSLQGLDVETG